MTSTSSEDRTFALKKPKGHRPPVPRWSLAFKDPAVTHLYTVYVGVQCHREAAGARAEVESVIDRIFASLEHPPAVDTFRVTDGFDNAGSKVWVAYWTRVHGFAATLSQLNPEVLWNALGDGREDIGLWTEHFTAPLERLETNYARIDHKPGLAQLPDTEQPEHELTAYWGAGRDRIPASAYDRFPAPEGSWSSAQQPKGFGEKLTGTNYDHMCHIRSGQWWELCDEEERSAYEGELEEKLMGGMKFLWDHAEDTGTLGLRFLQNLDSSGQPKRETCGAGFFRNWSDLEKWSSRDPSHLAIFNGMMAHAKRFGDARKFMTWHEVWIFKAGEARFEYVNCDPKTGVIGRVELESRPLSTAQS